MLATSLLLNEFDPAENNDTATERKTNIPQAPANIYSEFPFGKRLVNTLVYSGGVQENGFLKRISTA